MISGDELASVSNALNRSCGSSHIGKLIEVLLSHLDGHMSVYQLAMLASVYEADQDGKSLYVKDLADLCELPTSTASSMVAGLSNVTGGGVGFLSLVPDPEDRRRKFVRPSRRLKRLAKTIVCECDSSL